MTDFSRLNEEFFENVCIITQPTFNDILKNAMKMFVDKHLSTKRVESNKIIVYSTKTSKVSLTIFGTESRPEISKIEMLGNCHDFIKLTSILNGFTTIFFDSGIELKQLLQPVGRRFSKISDVCQFSSSLVFYFEKGTELIKRIVFKNSSNVSFEDAIFTKVAFALSSRVDIENQVENLSESISMTKKNVVYKVETISRFSGIPFNELEKLNQIFENVCDLSLDSFKKMKFEHV